VHGFPANGMATNLESGAAWTWGTTRVSAAGGLYQLCWCAAGYSCSLHEDFRVHAGTLEIVTQLSRPLL
jgi:hypothetical protein